MRIRVFLPLVIIMSIALALCGVIVGLTMSDEAFRQNILGVCLIAVFAGTTVGCFIWCMLTMTNIIEFDEKGVRRIRFGKVIRDFAWEKVKTIACTDDNTFTGWAYISEQEKKFDNGTLSIAKMRLDKEVIYFHMSSKAQEAILKYAPAEKIAKGFDKK